MRRRVSAMSERRAGPLTGDMTQSSRSSGLVLSRFVRGRFVLGAATVATGLTAGAFYVFACAVMPALAASALAFLVTVVLNVPLNDGLARGGDPAALREEFEDPWVAWNVVRAVLLTVTLGFLVKATGSRAAGRG